MKQRWVLRTTNQEVGARLTKKRQKGNTTNASLSQVTPLRGWGIRMTPGWSRTAPLNIDILAIRQEGCTTSATHGKDVSCHAVVNPREARARVQHISIRPVRTSPWRLVDPWGDCCIAIVYFLSADQAAEHVVSSARDAGSARLSIIRDKASRRIGQRLTTKVPCTDTRSLAI
ncbi:hypothetical protein CIB48_g5083 [Xylaria polymorpha]|nr:hypothetical protein CIB48_g5083 [Xylaria polymorpha]